MGSGPGVSCAVSLNTSLTPEQRARYQDVAQINDLLDKSKTIAIVGLSSDRQKASFFVAGGLAVIYLTVATPLYQSNAVLQVEKQQQLF